MTSGRPTLSAAPGRILLQAADARQTGALVVDAVPGGTVHLVDGQVSYAESPAAPGVGELLTASGRLAPRTWEAAVEAATPERGVGRLLIEQGHLTRGELELCILGAIHDAAYFALRPVSAPVEFATGRTHWLGPIITVEAAAVAREARRRSRMLDDIYPYPEVDTAPVIPVTRPPVERVTLTALQWELIVHADGQRTPADLAQLLGRAGYATVQELRRLAGCGLLEVPSGRPSPDGKPVFVRLPRSGGPAVAIRRPAAIPASPADQNGADQAPADQNGADQAPADQNGADQAPADQNGADQAPADPAPANPATPGPPAGEPTSADTTTPAADGIAEQERPPRLPRRRPNTKLPGGPVHPGTDEVLLKRLRTALRALR